MEGNSLQPEQSSRISVTYEALFDLVVREKSRDELQSLSPNFFAELVNYLNEKRSMLSVLSAEEKERASRQLQNINRLIRELYDRREKKTINMALARSRAGADIVDTSSLLAEEKAMFDGLVSHLDLFRNAVLNSLLEAKEPRLGNEDRQARAEALAAASRIISSPATSAISGTSFGMHGSGKEEAAGAATAEAETAENNATKLVRFLHPVPRFVGRELEVYGPFDQEDIANLPREIAEVLITKGRAEEIAQA
ncbi:DNA replication complex GINS family protein [Candidatus Woesearchaeota archaeon]|nr:DNA replication complex GINS family protein [Candidatus Woesearchaeota archaeon]